MATARRRLTSAVAAVGLVAAVAAILAGMAGGLVSMAPGAGASTPQWYVIATPGQNAPDAMVVKVGPTFFLYSSQTSIWTPPISVRTSRDLLSFGGPAAAAMPRTPPWAIDGFTWSPDVHHLGSRWVMYFDALAKASLYYDAEGRSFLARHAQCIGLATAARPSGPFVARSRPLVCQFSRHGSIDARLVRSPRGALYLDWKSDDNAAPPYHPTSLFAQRLSSDGLHLVGSPSVLMTADRPWQRGLVEAPDMVIAAGGYWLFYSGNWFNGASYATGVAKCRGILGPCSPITTSTWREDRLLGPAPGEGSVFQDAAGFFFLYAPWSVHYLASHARPTAVARLAFSAKGPSLMPIGSTGSTASPGSPSP